MKRVSLTVTCLILFASTLWAIEAFNARSKLMLAHRDGCAGTLNSRSADSYKAFITVQSAHVIDALCNMGVKVLGVFDGFVMAEIPVNRVQRVASIGGVRQVSLAQPLRLCNDSARYLSNVFPVHQSGDLPVALLGEGVIVGVIDTGIDFNHINFLDDNGRSRICAVYMPEDSSGISPVVCGRTLPGSCYETREQISALTADCFTSSHGTHTTGTAAGGYHDNGWHGVATKCDIVACGMPEEALTDVNVACAVSYIFDYAARAGKPCVINMSIGSNDGPNDGTSFLCRVFEALTGPGRICVLSAGNDGNAPVCFHASLSVPEDTVTTLLRNQWGGMQRNGYVSMWNDGPQAHRTRVVVINRQTGAIEYASPMMDILPADSVFTLSSETDHDFAQFYTGDLVFASAVDNGSDDWGLQPGNGRFHSYWVYDVTSVAAGHLLGLQYVAESPTMLSGWCTKSAYFYTFGLEGITGGTTAGSISDLATTDSVISVGAYCSRTSYVDVAGEEHVLSDIPQGDLAAFSSFGPDERGIARPDVCAPGCVLISSANRFNQESDESSFLTPVVIDGTSYPYYVNQGTSMSAPVVTGAVAMMLEVNPSLGVADVREVLYRTSTRDVYVESGDLSRWGYGKLNVAVAIDDVINNTLIEGDVNNDGEVNIADVMAIVELILASSSHRDPARLVRADLNRDAEVQIADINAVIRIILNQ